MPRRFLAIAMAAVLAPFAGADVYVDLVHVSDATGDGTPGAPWASITHAVTQVAPPETIVLAPGDYRQGTGESFPIDLVAGISLVASGNPENTRLIEPTITGAGAPDVLLVSWIGNSASLPGGPIDAG
ncbi:DUF1565 domain-containing protein [Engelhardtia mirabilis]|uniref:DUF1565 domain-containing protein n=1 Tax=Engelhardtia mirabilis TaxID=2528011 RepID=A0A518BPK5_9BACT|nr:hypothetical protein Pla133_40220 [Planctomycetes bacterium Pla133]QDV03234.1 hypothetical protein Pla86_40210 [Planctomycetes bacterium Pla86]